MKRIATIAAICIMLASCVSSPRAGMSRALGFAAGLVNRDEGEAAQKPAAQESTGAKQPAAASRETKPMTKKEAVLAAIDAFDLNELRKQLDPVKDVRDIVGHDVPLIYLAEKAMGDADGENPMTVYLIGKKAYTVDYGAGGYGVWRIIEEVGLYEGHPRAEYLLDISEAASAIFQEALKTDSPKPLIERGDAIRFGPSMIVTAASYKAIKLLDYLLDKAGPLTPEHATEALQLVCGYSDRTSYDARIGAAKAFLSAGADINALDKQDAPPLIALLRSAEGDHYNRMGSPEALALLFIREGSDLPRFGRPAVYLAVQLRNHALIRELMGRGAGIPEEIYSFYNMDFPTLKLLVELGADIQRLKNWERYLKEEERPAYRAFLKERGIALP